MKLETAEDCQLVLEAILALAKVMDFTVEEFDDHYFVNGNEIWFPEDNDELFLGIYVNDELVITATSEITYRMEMRILDVLDDIARVSKVG